MRRRAQAFSLVELVLVLVIIGVIGAIAAPRFTSASDRHRADAAAQRLANDLRLAAQGAWSNASDVEVLFLKSDGRYDYGIPDRHAGTDRTTVLLGDAPFNASFVAIDCGGDHRLSFLASGLPDTDAVVIIGVGQERRELSVKADTGAITVTTPIASRLTLVISIDDGSEDGVGDTANLEVVAGTPDGLTGTGPGSFTLAGSLSGDIVVEAAIAQTGKK